MALSHRVTLLLEDPVTGQFIPARQVSHGGKTYAVAQPGQRFKVEVATEGVASPLKVSTTIDGNNVGCSYALYPDYSTAIFHGWHSGHGRYTEFTFTPAAAGGQASGGAGPAQPLGRSDVSSTLGVINVAFSHTRQEKCRRQHPYLRSYCRQCAYHEAWFRGSGVPQAKESSASASGPGACASLPEQVKPEDDKKFYMKPSLRATSTGRVCHTEDMGSATHLVTDRSVAKVFAILHCETEEVLTLRKILPPPGASNSNREDTRRQQQLRRQSNVMKQEHSEQAVSFLRPSSGCRAAAVSGLSRESAILLDDDQEPPKASVKREAHEDRDRGQRKRQRRRPCLLAAEGNADAAVYMWEEPRPVPVVDLV